MGKNYEQDMIAAMKKQNDLIVQQVFIELIQVVSECETYDEFRKRMYGIALTYIKDLEAEGIKVPEQPETEIETKSEDKNTFIL
jgi:predicted RNase H-like HicB family nuclease